MPLPTPNSGESEKDFVSRCMGAEGMNSEFPEQKQRAAVCYSQWHRHTVKKSKTLVINGLLQLKKLSDDDRVIGGYASWPVVDAEGDLMTLEGLRWAWDPFIGSEYPIVTVGHESIPFGKVLPEYTDKHGAIYRSGVDNNGLYVVAKLRRDHQEAEEMWRQIELWGGQGAFSISASILNEPLARATPDGRCHYEYGPGTFELNSIGVGRAGVNPMSVFRILKAPKHKVLYIADKPKILVVRS